MFIPLEPPVSSSASPPSLNSLVPKHIITQEAWSTHSVLARKVIFIDFLFNVTANCLDYICEQGDSYLARHMEGF